MEKQLIWVFLAFLLVPLIEITLFINVGGLIGIWPTLAIVVLTAMIGSWLVRSQGLSALNNVKGSFSSLQDPTEHIAHGAMILFSGALLLTPGFFTDGIGFLLLIPGVRTSVIQYFKKRTTTVIYSTGQYRGGRNVDGEIIEGEFSETPTKEHSNQELSHWTKH